MEIKEAKNTDANRISYLIRTSIDKNPNMYSQKQIDIWKRHNTPSKIKKQLNDRVIFCALKGNKLIGTISIKDNTIHGFYISYSSRNKGIGTILLNHLEQYAITKKVKKLSLMSTPSAINFYKNKGYLANKETTVTLDNVEYIEVEMTKTLLIKQ